jgi:hypothetical protein
MSEPITPEERYPAYCSWATLSESLERELAD